MEYQVGSLADMISASSTKKMTVQLKKKTGSPGAKLEFKKITTPKIQSPQNVLKKKRQMEEVDSQHKRLRFSEPIEIETVSGDKNVGQHVKHIQKHKKRSLKEEKRTIFVGNLVNTTTREDLKKLFAPYGPIENVRLRSASVANPKTSKKVAVIKQEFHPARSNINAYIRYRNIECAEQAVAANGMEVDGHIIRVDMSLGSKPNPKVCVFVGNLKFQLEETDLRKVFEDCGKIVNVRIVRDKVTGIGKGFAFIEFENSDSVELALKLDREDLMGRPIRVTRVNGGAMELGRKKLKGNAKKSYTKSSTPKVLPAQGGVKSQEGDKKKKHIIPQNAAKQGKPVISGFQGETTDIKKANKKKKKQNKGELKKKIMQSKLGVTPKSKKNKNSKKK